MRVGRLLEEPLLIHRIGDHAERQAQVEQLLDLVGLPAEAAGRFPHEFSGGQRQRLGLTYVFISHDLAVVRYLANTVVVMYLGEIESRAGVRDAEGDHVADRKRVRLGHFKMTVLIVESGDDMTRRQLGDVAGRSIRAGPQRSGPAAAIRRTGRGLPPLPFFLART
jgi:ABC-type antimicrobial peptide transport system ATPase subunit